MIRCNVCGTLFPRPAGSGRPPKYCSDECKREGKRKIHNNPRNPRDYLTCCLDHQASGGTGRCPQHRDDYQVRYRWRRRYNDLRRRDDTDEERYLWDALASGHGMTFRDVIKDADIRTGPDEGESTSLEPFWDEPRRDIAEKHTAAMEDDWWMTLGVDFAVELEAFYSDIDFVREDEQRYWYEAVTAARYALEEEMQRDAEMDEIYLAA